MGGRGAGETSGPLQVAVDRGDGGEPEESFVGVGEIDRLAAELKLLTERASRAVRVAGQHRGQSGVAADQCADGGIVERPGDRLGSVEELLRVAIAVLP